MADKGQVLELDFPITVATAPYRVTNAPFPILQYGKYNINIQMD